MGLRLHYFMCKGCKQVGKQLETIHHLTQRFKAEKSIHLGQNSQLTHQARKRISAAMKDNPDGHS